MDSRERRRLLAHDILLILFAYELNPAGAPQLGICLRLRDDPRSLAEGEHSLRLLAELVPLTVSITGRLSELLQELVRCWIVECQEQRSKAALLFRPGHVAVINSELPQHLTQPGLQG